MRILWDFRLFSYGYRDRGIGVFVRGMAKAIVDAGLKGEIYIWGNRGHVPAELAGYAVRWIPYEKGTWKSDLFMIPFIIIRHRIKLFHYWVAMGPIFRIGMGLFHPCATCMTVYDLGVEHLRNDGYLNHVRRTGYWRIQKILVTKADAVVCISRKTKEEVTAFTKGNLRRCDVIYLPMTPKAAGAEGAVLPGKRTQTRMRMFVTLGGAPHKNVPNVVQAFSIFTKTHPGYCLVVLGTVENDATPLPAPDAVFFEAMDRYAYYLDNAAGLIACSTYEGLGIPALDAMSRGCPLVASDIPVFHETCGDGAARFVDPSDASSIAEGMHEVADRQEEWMEKSGQGFLRYERMSETAGKQWLELYDSLGATGSRRF
jgi:glycosyltransferase involved in cell wall biosynthesis